MFLINGADGRDTNKHRYVIGSNRDSGYRRRSFVDELSGCGHHMSHHRTEMSPRRILNFLLYLQMILWHEACLSPRRKEGKELNRSVLMFKNYVKVALRNIWKQKAYSFINIVGLAIGMACCILILLWAFDELSYDQFFEHKGEIHRVVREIHRPGGEIVYSTVTPAALGPVLEENYPEIINSARHSTHRWTVGAGEKRFTEIIALVDPEIFGMLSMRFVRGNAETALANITDIVITDEVAKKIFGEEDALGKTLRIEDWYDANISGVVENLPGNSHFQKVGVFFPFQLYTPLWGRDLNSWTTNSYRTYVLLERNARAKEVEAKIAGLVQSNFPESNSELMLQPITKIHLYDLEGGGLITYIYIFSWPWQRSFWQLLVSII